MGRTGYSLIVILLLTAAVTSCRAQDEPHIIQTSAKLIQTFDPAREVSGSHLEIHVHLSGDDQDHGIVSMQVKGPASSFLVWDVDIDYLFTAFTDGELWIGSNSLQPPAEGRFPSGTYRVTVTNTSGLSDDMEFTISDPFKSGSVPPDLFPVYDRDINQFRSSTEKITFRGFDANGNPIGAVDISSDLGLSAQRDMIEAQLNRPIAGFELEITDPLLLQVFRTGMYPY
jgi:hypothetical protein